MNIQQIKNQYGTELTEKLLDNLKNIPVDGLIEELLTYMPKDKLHNHMVYLDNEIWLEKYNN